MRRPTLQLAVAFNARIRTPEEWFSDPDDLDRLETALRSIAAVDDPIEAAAVIAFRVARAQAFTEGNKRTALLLAKWILDHNGLSDRVVIRPDDHALADLLVKAASGIDVETDIIELLVLRAREDR